MSTTALVFMIVTQLTVTGITLTFFIKVLRAKPRMEPDSYLDNDDIPGDERTDAFEKEEV